MKVIAKKLKMQFRQTDVPYFYGIKKQMNSGQKVALGLDESQEIRFPADKGLAGYVVKKGSS